MKFIFISPLTKGAGSSTVATNLSYCLPCKEEKVLLIQADGAFSGTDVLLDLPKGDVPGWRTADVPFEELIWKVSPSFFYLPAGRGKTASFAGKDFTKSGVELLESLRKSLEFDWIVLDGFDRVSLSSPGSPRSDIALYVVEPNSSGMQTLSEFLQTDKCSQPGTYCVVNKHHQQSRLEQDLVKIFRNLLQERFCPVVFPFDEIALRAALRKEPLCKNFSFTELGGKFHDLATWVKLQFISGEPEKVVRK